MRFFHYYNRIIEPLIVSILCACSPLSGGWIARLSLSHLAEVRRTRTVGQAFACSVITWEYQMALTLIQFAKRDEI